MKKQNGVLTQTIGVCQDLDFYDDVKFVIRRTSTLLRVPEDKLLSKSREQRVITARHVAMYVSMVTFDYSETTIGRLFGNTHSNASKVLHKIDRYRNDNPKFRIILNTLETEALNLVKNQMPIRFQLK